MVILTGFFKKAVKKNNLCRFNDIGFVNGKENCKVFIGSHRYSHFVEVCVLKMLYKFGRHIIDGYNYIYNVLKFCLHLNRQRAIELLKLWRFIYRTDFSAEAFFCFYAANITNQ